MKYIKLLKTGLAAAVLSVIFVACSQTISYNQEAVRVYMKDLLNNTTFAAFKVDMDQYLPDTNIVNQIKTAFNPAQHKIYMFANFSCGCTSQQTDIAHICRVLSDSKIDTSFYEIYSMIQATDKQPYMSRISLKILPEIIVMKDTTAVYFVMDTLNRMFPAPEIEQLLLNGLKK